jgi:1,6-anhydro-N-acetylmuramate kinase
MTGTSIDGDLDAALLAIEGEGLAMRATVVATLSWPLGALAAELRAIATGAAFPAAEFTRVARAFGEVHADALLALSSDAGVTPDLAVLHGQTVFHAPPRSWQLLDPWPVAVRLGCRVRFDLRGANLASGGEGAPITPLADFVLFGDAREPRAIVNLGGFANATLLPPRAGGVPAIRGFDACACNHLLDAVARIRLGTAFDADGAAARAGRADEALVRAISDAIAPPSAPGSARRSLGTGDEAVRLVERTSALSAADACRTIVEALADALARTLRAEIGATPCALLLAGGGARNATLRAEIARRWDGAVRTTEDSHGVGVSVRESACMAVLGALADDGVPYALRAVTGTASKVLDSALIEPMRSPRGPL